MRRKLLFSSDYRKVCTSQLECYEAFYTRRLLIELVTIVMILSIIASSTSQLGSLREFGH